MLTNAVKLRNDKVSEADHFCYLGNKITRDFMSIEDDKCCISKESFWRREIFSYETSISVFGSHFQKVFWCLALYDRETRIVSRVKETESMILRCCVSGDYIKLSVEVIKSQRGFKACWWMLALLATSD